MNKRSLRISVPILMLAALLSPSALAWEEVANLEVVERGVMFYRVVASNSAKNPCKLRVTVFLQSPDAQVRRFAMRVEFRSRIEEGAPRSVEFRPFKVARKGRKERTYIANTKPEGCWAEKFRMPEKLVVAGCEGKRCKPELTPIQPETPDKPKAPEKPDVPSKPKTPDVPSKPKTPDTPKAP